jgi:hypothetical protein
MTSSRVGLMAMVIGTVSTASAVAIVAAPTIQPFYLEQTTSASDPDTHIFGLHGTLTVARRSDGTTVRVESVGPPWDGYRVRHVSMPNGNTASFVDAHRLKTTWPAQSNAVGGYTIELIRRLARTSGDCRLNQARETVQGSNIVSGQPIVIVRIDGSPEHTFMSWRAPALACEELYYSSERHALDGSTTLALEKTTQTLLLEEPDAKWFATGSDYEEVAPSVALRRLLANWIVTLPENVQKEFERELQQDDQQYTRHLGPV